MPGQRAKHLYVDIFGNYTSKVKQWDSCSDIFQYQKIQLLI